MSFFPMIHAVNAFAGAWFAFAMLTYAKAPSLRIRPEPNRQLQGRHYVVRVGLNMILSASMVYGWVYFLRAHLVHAEATAWWRIPAEAVLVLVVYDFLYYFLHRYPFHQWNWLKRVHAVHHMAKYPIATDSLFLHPLENFLGLALLVACIAMVGPIHELSFIVCYAIYSILNIVVHEGVSLPFPFTYFSMLSRKHDKHHATMSAGNFASLSPIPDLIFGTVEK